MLDRDAVARWLWHPTNVAARLARVPLLPFTGAYAAWVRGRAGAYACGLARARDPGIPVIAVGNLSLGGTGKTPLASWIAERCLALGVRPGIVLRGYGRDEAALPGERVPRAVVVTGRDRVEAVRRAARLGAEVAILDDGFQRLDVARRLNVLVVSAESAAAPPWLLPAGPGREAWRAARRADLIVGPAQRGGTGPLPHAGAPRAALRVARMPLPHALLPL